MGSMISLLAPSLEFGCRVKQNKCYVMWHNTKCYVTQKQMLSDTKTMWHKNVHNTKTNVTHHKGVCSYCSYQLLLPTILFHEKLSTMYNSSVEQIIRKINSHTLALWCLTFVFMSCTFSCHITLIFVLHNIHFWVTHNIRFLMTTNFPSIKCY